MISVEPRLGGEISAEVVRKLHAVDNLFLEPSGVNAMFDVSSRKS